VELVIRFVNAPGAAECALGCARAWARELTHAPVKGTQVRGLENGEHEAIVFVDDESLAERIDIDKHCRAMRLVRREQPPVAETEPAPVLAETLPPAPLEEVPEPTALADMVAALPSYSRRSRR